MVVLPFAFSRHRHLDQIPAVPRGPWLQPLQPLAGRVDLEDDVLAVFGRLDIGGAAAGEIVAGHVGRGLRCVQLEGAAVGTDQAVGQGIEREPAGERPAPSPVRDWR